MAAATSVFSAGLTTTQFQKKSNTTTFRTIKCMSQPQDDIKPSSAPKVSTQFSDLLSFRVTNGQDLFTQVSNGGLTVFVGTSVVMTIASLVPLFKGVRAESKSNGLMTSDGELWNGRFAMLGLVGLAFTEFVQGTPLV
ncbi:hypothetical protein Tco_1122356 [Tanacetum coccineum]|uniref:Chlorophyll A-B binding protein n=1 Tax=Tanacetum coccineum TaxID=301880 RepID=A0ABQ5J0S9_9ASTR